ncbi:hypothetical protein ASH01_22280 [Terrabacter sp. Soil811]|nr:hypothetical protein ASH01_22280 [Terrabacter sp. Soil811]
MAARTGMPRSDTEGVMADSDVQRSIGETSPVDVVNAFRRLAGAVANPGGAQKGMLLQDLEVSAIYVVVRR